MLPIRLLLILPTYNVITDHAYLIFVISFTQATFFNSKFYTRKLTKNTPKTLKNVPEKSNICSFCIQSGKCYTWQNIFTRAPPMVPVTIIRYAHHLLPNNYPPPVSNPNTWWRQQTHHMTCNVVTTSCTRGHIAAFCQSCDVHRGVHLDLKIAGHPKRCLWHTRTISSPSHLTPLAPLAPLLLLRLYRFVFLFYYNSIPNFSLVVMWSFHQSL